METWNAITSRRNVRSYADQQISSEHLDTVLEAGRRAPSSMNTQPAEFVLVTDRPTLRRLSKVWKGAQHVAEAPAAVALVVKTPPQDAHQREVIRFDLGQTTMAMMLAAADLGIGSAHASVDDQPLAREVLGLPPDRDCAFLIALGYPQDRPRRPIRRPDRRPFDDVVHVGSW